MIRIVKSFGGSLFVHYDTQTVRYSVERDERKSRVKEEVVEYKQAVKI